MTDFSAGTLFTILVSVIVSSSTTGLIIFLLKNWFASYLEYIFHSRASKESLDRELTSQKISELFTTASNVYPEIVEIVGRIKTSIRESSTISHYYDWNANSFVLLTLYSENLFRYRMFVPEDTFEKMHELKIVVSGLLSGVKEFKTIDTSTGSEVFESFMSERKECFSRVEVLTTEIIHEIKSYAYEKVKI